MLNIHVGIPERTGLGEAVGGTINAEYLGPNDPLSKQLPRSPPEGSG